MSFIDTAIFVLFLIVTLVVGLRYSKGIKTMEDYALGGRNFSTAAITATIVATWVSGSIFSLIISKTYTIGLQYIIPALGLILCLFSMAYIFAPRMGEFLGNISVADTMGKLYGNKVRIITAIAGSIAAIGSVSVQFKVSSSLIGYFWSDSNTVIIITSFIVVLYASFGGIKAVTFTDVFQFITFGTFVPVLGLLIWNSIYDINSIFNVLKTNPIFDYRTVCEGNNLFSMLGLLLFYVIPTMSSATFQRVLISRDTKQIAKSFTSAGLILFIVMSITIWIGILVLAINPNLDPSNLLGYLLDQHPAIGMKGLAVAGIIAMVMSTADSHINSSSVLLSYDVCKLFKMSTKNELILSRVFAVILGILSIVLALSFKDILDIILMTASFYMPIVTVPLILAIFGFRSSSRSVLIGMGFGLTCVVFWRWKMMFTKVDSVIPGMVANIIGFIGSHYILGEQGGWVGIKDPKPLIMIRQERKRKWNKFIKSIKNFSFIEFCKYNFPKRASSICLLGFFMMVSTFSVMYSLPSRLELQHGKILSFIYHSSSFIAMLFFIYPIWPLTIKSFKRIIAVAWNISVLYSLVLTTSFIVFLSDFSQFTLMMFVINLIAVASLFRWKTALSMIIIGVFISMNFYEQYMNVEQVPILKLDIQFKIIYILVIISSFLVIFNRPRQEELELEHEMNEKLTNELKISKRDLQKALYAKDEILNNIQHETTTPLVASKNATDILLDIWDNIQDSEKLFYIKMIQQANDRGVSYIEDLQNLAKYNIDAVTLNYSSVDLADLINESIDECKKFYLGEKSIDIITDIKIKDCFLECDKAKVAKVIHHILKNALLYSVDGIITITVNRTKINDVTSSKSVRVLSALEVSIQDQGPGIPDDEIIHIFDPFFQSRWTSSPAEGRGIGLAISRKIIEAHSGKITCINVHPKGAQFSFVLPIHKVID